MIHYQENDGQESVSMTSMGKQQQQNSQSCLSCLLSVNTIKVKHCALWCAKISALQTRVTSKVSSVVHHPTCQ